MPAEQDPAQDPSLSPDTPLAPQTPAPITISAPTPATPPAEQNQTPTASTPADPRLEKLAKLGFAGVTGDDALDRVIAAYELQQQTVSQQVQSAVTQALTELRTQAAQPAAGTPQPTAQQNAWWNPPQVDPALISQYRQGDGWKPGTPENVIRQANELMAYQDAFARKLISNPVEALAPLKEEIINAAIERLTQTQGQTEAQRQEAAYFEKVLADNPWLFERDPVSGKPRQDAYSAAGRLIDQEMRQLQEQGLTRQMAWEHCYLKHQMRELQGKQQAGTAAQTAAEINAQKQRDFLAKGNGTDRKGVLPSATDDRAGAQNKKLSFADRFRRDLQSEGAAT